MEGGDGVDRNRYHSRRSPEPGAGGSDDQSRDISRDANRLNRHVSNQVDEQALSQSINRRLDASARSGLAPKWTKNGRLDKKAKNLSASCQTTVPDYSHPLGESKLLCFMKPKVALLSGRMVRRPAQREAFLSIKFGRSISRWRSHE